MGYRRMAGYQPELVCLLSWLPTDKIPVLTDISINSKYGLYRKTKAHFLLITIFSFYFHRLIFGLDNGLVVVDYLSQSILMNMATSDLYGTMDPFQRTSISPKRRGTSNDSNNDDLTPSDYQVNIFWSIRFSSLGFFLIETKQTRMLSLQYFSLALFTLITCFTVSGNRITSTIIRCFFLY